MISKIKKYKPKSILIEHKHTGKLVHYRHTAYLILFFILLALGLFIFATGGFAGAKSLSQDVSVSAVVPVTSTNSVGTFISTNNTSDNLSYWFETPVPLYFMILTLTLGFWIGDLFDRRFGISKYRRKN